MTLGSLEPFFSKLQRPLNVDAHFYIYFRKVLAIEQIYRFIETTWTAVLKNLFYV